MVSVLCVFFLRTLFLFLSGAERDTHKRNNSISFQLSKPMSLSKLFSRSWVRIYLQGQQHHQKAHLTVAENSQKLHLWSSLCARRRLHHWVLSLSGTCFTASVISGCSLMSLGHFTSFLSLVSILRIWQVPLLLPRGVATPQRKRPHQRFLSL